MLPSQLHDLMAGKIQAEAGTRTLTLNAAFLAEAEALAKYLIPGVDHPQFVIDGPQMDPANPAPVVTGTATFLGIPNVSVTLTGGGDDQVTWLRLAATKLPDDWRLSRSFTNLPPYWAAQPGDFGLSLQDSFLDSLPIGGPRFVVATSEDKDEHLVAGVNLFGSLSLDATFAGGLAGMLLQWIEGNAPMALAGTIQLRNGKPPVVDLRAEVEALPAFDLQAFHAGKAFVWLRTIESRDSAPVSRMDLAIPVLINASKPLSLTISTELWANSGQFIFEATSEDKSFSLGNTLHDIATALGISAGADALPASFPTLASLYLKRVVLIFSTQTRKPQALSFVLALPETTPWHTPVPKLDMTAFEIEWVSFFDDATRPWQGRVSAQFSAGKQNPVLIDLSADFPQLLFVGTLDADSPPISLTDLLASFVDVSSLPDIKVASFYVAYDVSEASLQLSLTLRDVWSFQLGKLPKFSITEIAIGLTCGTKAGTSPAGSLHGEAQLGTVSFDVDYAFPSNDFSIVGKIPVIQLGELVQSLCDAPLDLADRFDLQLRDSQIAIQRSGADTSFLLRTTVEKFGELFFEIRRGSSGWGAAAGIDLGTIHNPGDVPGLDFLHVGGIRVERLMLVLSSVDLPQGFTFPDLPVRPGIAPATTAVRIPNGIGSPKQGLNLYAQFTFGDPAATTYQPLLDFYKKFEIKKLDVDIAIQLGKQDGALRALLLAGVTVEVWSLSIQASLGLQYSSGNIQAFLQGHLQTPAPYGAPGEMLSFDARLDILTNGVELAGSMLGRWSNAFGVAGLTITSVGLAAGITWEGVPLLGVAGALTDGSFDGSLGFVINTAKLEQSALFGSLSDLSLGDVLDTFVHSKDNPQGVAADVINVLRGLKITGVTPFDLDPSLIPALDKLNLNALADAFQQKQVTLSRTPANTFLVAGIPGQRWFVTDIPNRWAHYEIEYANGRLTVKREAQLYFVPTETQIAGIPLPRGVRVQGSLDIFGYIETTDVEILPDVGARVDQRMSEINLLNIITLSRGAASPPVDNDLGGPYLSFATFAQGPNPPHFKISGNLTLLGLSVVDIDAQVSAAGISFDTQRRIFLIDFELGGTFKKDPITLTAHVGLTYGFKDGFDLPLIGHVALSAGVSGDIAIGYANGAVVARLTLSIYTPFGTLQASPIDLGANALANPTSMLNDAVRSAIGSYLTGDVGHLLAAVGAGVIAAEPVRAIPPKDDMVIDAAAAPGAPVEAAVAPVPPSPEEVGRMLYDVFKMRPEEVPHATRLYLGYSAEQVKRAVSGATAAMARPAG